MSKVGGCIGVLICTIAFGMGVNCKGVKRVIHFGPSKSVEAYIQESGRAGKDGQPSTTLLLYQSLMLLHVEKNMKDYVKGKYDCRRKFLMEHFTEKAVKAQTATSTGICCDMCSKDGNLLIPVATLSPRVGNTRPNSSEEKKFEAQAHYTERPVFQDIHQEERQPDYHRDYCDEDDEEEDYWNELLNDADLMNIDWDDVSSSKIDDSSFLDESQDFESSCMHVPELGGLIDKVQIQ